MEESRNRHVKAMIDLVFISSSTWFAQIMRTKIKPASYGKRKGKKMARKPSGEGSRERKVKKTEYRSTQDSRRRFSSPSHARILHVRCAAKGKKRPNRPVAVVRAQRFINKRGRERLRGVCVCVLTGRPSFFQELEEERSIDLVLLEYTH